MLTGIIPKLPMIDKVVTMNYYLEMLGFSLVSNIDFDGYLMLEKDNMQIHFFEFKSLDPKENYGQVYIRTNDIENLYQKLISKNVPVHPSGHLQLKPWGQIEFALLDPNNNLLTFGQTS